MRPPASAAGQRHIQCIYHPQYDPSMIHASRSLGPNHSIPPKKSSIAAFIEYTVRSPRCWNQRIPQCWLIYVRCLVPGTESILLWDIPATRESHWSWWCGRNLPSWWTPETRKSHMFSLLPTSPLIVFVLSQYAGRLFHYFTCEWGDCAHHKTFSSCASFMHHFKVQRIAYFPAKWPESSDSPLKCC